MEKKTVAEITGRKSIDHLLQSVLDILEADDGRSFDEKRSDAVRILQQKEGSDLAEILVDCIEEEQKGRKIRDKFWSTSDIIHASAGIELRKVCGADREKFLEVRLAYSAMKAFMKEDAHQNMLWNEHTQDTALMFSVFQNDDYAGYCGIHNVTRDVWEIAIELQPKKTNRGIGTLAITTMLNAIKERLGKSDYRVRIEPTNYASQRLFEKLGAVPNGIFEFSIHDPKLLEECEEENLHLIDDDLIAVAKKFSVAPRKLLSHILEYTLKW